MYFEIYRNGNLIKRGREILNELSWSSELMTSPQLPLTLPIDYLDYVSGREQIKVFVNDKCFWGIVNDLNVNKAAETIDLDIAHIIHEWTFRQIAVNRAIDENEALNVIYKGEKVTKRNGESITANDFSVTAKSISKLTLTQWVEKAHAQAWSSATGDKLPITSVDTSKVKKDDGTYNVTFSTANGTSVTVECTVRTEIEYQSQKTHSDKTNKETIAATPFTADIGLGLTAEQVKTKVKASAWVYRKKSEKVAVTSITTNFKNEAGTYNVTASTAKGTSITVKVTIKEEEEGSGSVDPSIIDKIEDIYADYNFAYPGWELDFQNNAGSRVVDYVYSKQNKLEALTKTCELTSDLFWRVGFTNEKVVEIGSFGDIEPYIISTKPSGESNIRMVEEPTIDYDFSNTINVASVYGEKSDSGMSSLTLREVYENENLQEKGFPVVILRSQGEEEGEITTLNTERNYRIYVQYPKLAPNNCDEFAVIDEEGVALESGELIEGSFAFNDLGAFNTSSKKITNEKRRKAAQTAYHAAIKKLKQARRTYTMQVMTEQLPSSINVGDRVRVMYDNRIWHLEACSNYWKKVLSYDDYFYITRIDYNIRQDGTEVDTLTLAKYIKVERETNND